MSRRRPGGEAYAAALACLPGIGPATLAAILQAADPEQAWDGVRRGEIVGCPADRAGSGQGTLDVGEARPGVTARRWAAAARRITPPEWWAPKSARGIRVTWPGEDTYPRALAADPQPPGVLFWRGSIECLDRPCVAIVGTRNATPDGRATAFELGRDLARAGICVVSGLALGIDGAAHAGALESTPGLHTGGLESIAGPHAGTLESAGASQAGAAESDRIAGAPAAPPSPAPTVGVAASGVDVPYPRRHARLWERVVAGGAILSETPPGRPAQPWRFPSRNRIIAGLSRLVVVVESHARGGSLITAEAALDRGIEVRVVPGPVRSPASEGSNQLLYDGPGPVRHARDVLDCLGMLLPGEAEPAGCRRRQSGLPLVAAAVLEVVGWRPSTLGQIVARSGKQVADLLPQLDVLIARGLVREEGGWWSRIK